MNDTALSPEFRLVAACCRPRTFADFDAVVADEAANGWDADTLLQLARAHRVEGFVEDGLRRAGVALPEAAAELLAARAMQSRLQMVRNAGEEIRMTTLFAAHGIEPRLVKGATLAMLAHGSLTLKSSWDIDMLVAPEAVGTARKVLAQAGYRLDLPGIYNPDHIETFFRRNKETIWVNDARGTMLELHSALVDDRGLLRGIDANSPAQRVSVAGDRTVATLESGHLFAYLCVHGTLHRWERLKWLTDVAAFAESGHVDIEKVHADAAARGTEHAIGTALALSGHIFGTRISQVRPRRPVEKLVAVSLSALRTNARPDPTARSGLATAIDRVRPPWLLGDGPAAKLSVIASLLDYSPTPARLAVPDWALRPHLLLWLPWRMLTRPWRDRQFRDGNSASKP